MSAAVIDEARLATLAARLSLAGFTVYAVDGDADDDGPTFQIRRWGLHKEVRSLDELELFLRRVTEAA